MEQIHNFYHDNYDPLETPHIEDFSQVASEQLDEDKNRVLEYAKHIHRDEENKIRFNTTGVGIDE